MSSHSRLHSIFIQSILCMMADVAHPLRRRVPCIEKWHETVHAWSKPQLFDQALNFAIYAATTSLMIVFVYTFIISYPDIRATNNDHCSQDVSNQEIVRAQRRLQHRAFELMRSQCSEKVTVLTSNNIEVDNEPYPGRIAYMCRLGIKLVNPVTLRRGRHVGKCQETHNNVTKNKTRHFPIVANTSSGEQHRFADLPSACEFEHAIERLLCRW